MRDDFETMWEKTSFISSYNCRIFLKRTRENHEKTVKIRDLFQPELLKYEAGMPTVQLHYLVTWEEYRSSGTRRHV
jgi:hypothetical protein